MKKIVAGLLVFLAPNIINVVLGIASNDVNNVQNCFKNATLEGIERAYEKRARDLMDKALNTIGICKCANKISYGETLINDIKNRNVCIVVICVDTSENSKKKIINKCSYYGCEYVIAFTQEEIKRVLSRDDIVSAIGIKDKNLKKKFKENIEREGKNDGKE